MKRIKKFRLSVVIIVSLFSTIFLAQAVLCADYPTRAVTVICWSSPGAPNDVLARQIAKVGQKYFGQSMNVLTKKGGGGAVAMGHLLKQKKDGYNLLTTTSSMPIAMAEGKLPFTPDQFTYLMRIQQEPFLIAVLTESPFNDLNDMMDYAKKNPGKLSIGGFGTASAHFLAFKRLALKAGNPNIRWIAYEGGADAAVACLGGHTNAVHTNYVVIGEHVKAGKMKILGVSSEERVSFLPNVKTYTEQGYSTAPAHWRGLMGPAGMPEDVVKKIRGFMEQTVADPEFKAFMKNAGAEFAIMESQEKFQSWVTNEVKENHELMKSLGLLGKKEKK
ncbi:MAG: tripartite tricarboxylate transporter substrate binding protein [Deltaproteobacteria bacterium]|nr:tripartite tricarboxylate transporter substrate binding protein [Deltaproteobacteria bacterium]